MLNKTMDEVVLVKGWKKSASWSFPRGKINKDEKDIDCAIREVYEETGYDIRAAGLIGEEEQVKSIEVTMREQHMKLFVFPNVPRETFFQPRTRKEISKIAWYKLSDLPTLKRSKQLQSDGQDLTKSANKFYMVAPFMVPLKKHIAHLKKQGGSKSQVTHQSMHGTHVETPNTVSTAQPVIDDMSRLMAQLRQSQQASRENNFPEVSNPVDSARSASVQLRNLLNLPTPPMLQDDEASARENKAQAMLSLLRGNDIRFGMEPNSTTPFDEVTEQLAESLLSPKHPPDREGQRITQVESSSFSIPVIQSTAQIPHQAIPMNKFTGTSFPSSQTPLQSLIHHASKQQTSRPYSTMKPPSWTASPSHAHSSQFLGDQQTVAPPASKLPMPRLNEHSSALLRLFKMKDMAQPQNSSQLVQLPAEQPGGSPELSASRPGTVIQMSTPFGRPALQESKSVSSSLGAAMPITAIHAPPKALSQQETLLSLFKSPTPTGEQNPPIVSMAAPVELAATQHSTGSNARRLQATVTRDDLSTAPVKFPARNISPLTEDERAQNSSQGSKLGLSPDLSATVTGPLSDLQFDHVHRSPEKKARVRQQVGKVQGKTNAAQPPVKILPRPGSSHKAPVSVNQGLMDEVSPSQAKATQTARPFHPQILKRPIANSASSETTTAPAPVNVPQKILNRSSIDHRRPSSQISNQRASLLALFTKPTSDTPPVMSASALPVSPLSERPALESALPSPFGVGRSRIGSLQSLAGESLSTGVQTPKPTGSPVDNRFLLGFLDGVAKERRN